MTDAKEAVLTLLGGILKTCPTCYESGIADIIAEFKEGGITVDDAGVALGSVMAAIYECDIEED